MTLLAADSALEQRLRAFGLLPAEYAHILDRLGREPNHVELGILGAMWSEHCGYKHSRRLLKKLPTNGPRVVQGPGENAGAVDIGDGLAVVLKMESHNHPSAVEPFQGAATGVGGILRDIFTMGARPVAILDSLRFGDPTDPRTRYLLDGVVGGIAHYGNCFGTPTVGGEISFDPGYTGNPIVNAMCIGVVAKEKLTRARASGPGNTLLLVGADTGQDGLQGAAFASNDDPEASHRGVVQVGNPFLEKLLLEACLAVLDTGDVIAMQDLGAAGLTSSTVEMAARGGLGAEIDVARVPRRESGLSAFEVMLSESQERMLLLVRAGSEDRVQRHFARWDLHCAAIGSVTDTGQLLVRDGAEVVAELPIPLLTDEVPAYELTPIAPSVPQRTVSDHQKHLGDLLRSPNLCSRRFAFRQYDSTVQGNTVLGPGNGAAAVVRVEGTSKGLAITTDCNPRYMRIDPRWGAAQAVAEAARNLACVGAEPIAVTDCLNFGNPEKALVAWQLTEAVEGLAEACRVLGIPVVSGNVSLYNESAGRAIPPTPTIGMVGLLEDVTCAVPVGFVDDSRIVLLGEPAQSAVSDVFPRLDLGAEQKLGGLLRALAERRLLRSAQDISDGGLVVAIAECCFVNGIGARAEIDGDIELFSEDQGRAIVTCGEEQLDAVLALAGQRGVAARKVGTTGGERLVIGASLDHSVRELKAAWEGGLA
jgi:phosphoribosylformylglycinamidine synthase II